ncbi:caspase domain-containing protein [Streptomyces sp. UNOB3_S3]|uniref:caspase family protein n=1 Tax=Streptomyces sp. UNOB3_S3 TaxID=2871682 RepID=UPI001E42E5B1|nr:caspase family protein [Streptomyces sp. UNOB3_S3]MCC3777900.1 caspase family protein [Streptomyces sp. UNOB3_S3]
MTYLPDPGRSRAVLVGVSQYADPDRWPALPAVRANIADLRAVLTDRGLWGLPAEHVSALVDPRDTGLVMETVATATEAAEDTVVFYYAGHGSPAESDLLLPLAATTTQNLSWRSLRYSAVREVLRQRRAAHCVVLLDCCFSGMAHAMADVDSFMDLQISATSAYTLTSAARDSISLAPPGDTYTAFTGELLGILRAGLPGGGPALPLGEVARAVTAGLGRRGLPLPRHSHTGPGDQLALVRNRQWPGDATPRSEHEDGVAATPPPPPPAPEEPPAEAHQAVLALLEQSGPLLRRGRELGLLLPQLARKWHRIPASEPIVAMSVPDAGVTRRFFPQNLLVFTDRALYVGNPRVVVLACGYDQLPQHRVFVATLSEGAGDGTGPNHHLALVFPRHVTLHGPWHEHRAQALLKLLHSLQQAVGNS